MFRGLMFSKGGFAKCNCKEMINWRRKHFDQEHVLERQQKRTTSIWKFKGPLIKSSILVPWATHWICTCNLYRKLKYSCGDFSVVAMIFAEKRFVLKIRKIDSVQYLLFCVKLTGTIFQDKFICVSLSVTRLAKLFMPYTFNGFLFFIHQQFSPVENIDWLDSDLRRIGNIGC